MSFVWNNGLLSRLWESLWRSLGLAGKRGSLLVLGLDNAGKTTLLYTLSTGESRSFPPTDRPALNTFHLPSDNNCSSRMGSSYNSNSSNVQFTAWDLGGHEAVRHLWEDYMSESVSAVLFLIDAADSERLEEAAYELDALIGEKVLGLRCTGGNGGGGDGSNNSSSSVPVAILLNKCDMTESVLSTEEICERIEFTRLASEYGGEMKVFRISVLKREGYQAAFRWISSFLK